MCEELSLTGNHCTARRHTVPGTKEETGGKVAKILNTNFNLLN